MYYGFGIDVPYTKFGTTSKVGHPVADNSGTCGDSFAVQQMLSDLGYYTGPIDGAIGTGSMTALRKFSEATGVPYTKGTFPKADTCQGLINAWVKSKTPAPSAAVVKTVAPATTTATATKPTTTAATTVKKTTTTAAPKPSGAAGMLDKVKTWWGHQSTMVKVGIAGGAVVTVGLLIFLPSASSAPATAVANRRRRRR